MSYSRIPWVMSYVASQVWGGWA